MVRIICIQDNYSKSTNRLFTLHHSSCFSWVSTLTTTSYTTCLSKADALTTDDDDSAIAIFVFINVSSSCCIVLAQWRDSVFVYSGGLQCPRQFVQQRSCKCRLRLGARPQCLLSLYLLQLNLLQHSRRYCFHAAVTSCARMRCHGSAPYQWRGWG
jgi:hypothetical protein